MPESTEQTTLSGGGWLAILEEDPMNDGDSLDDGYAGHRRSKRRHAR